MQGTRWRVDDGNHVQVFNDPWLPNYANFYISELWDAVERALSRRDSNTSQCQ